MRVWFKWTMKNKGRWLAVSRAFDRILLGAIVVAAATFFLISAFAAIYKRPSLLTQAGLSLDVLGACLIASGLPLLPSEESYLRTSYDLAEDWGDWAQKGKQKENVTEDDRTKLRSPLVFVGLLILVSGFVLQFIGAFY
ncbi:MAG: hypothetical protein HY521_14885 [Proteobacteria bacterium]|nr:hypothetical protein [Pseudomonadota bacterium]